MEMLHAVLDLFSVRIVDDLDDTASKADSASIASRDGRRTRDRDRDRDRTRGRDRYEQLKTETKDQRRKIETLEKDLATAKEEVERNRKKRKDVEAERTRLVEQNRELEGRLDALQSNFERTVEELERLREVVTPPHSVDHNRNLQHTTAAAPALDLSWTEPAHRRSPDLIHNLNRNSTTLPDAPVLDVAWAEGPHMRSVDPNHSTEALSQPRMPAFSWSEEPIARSADIDGHDAGDLARKLAEKEQELRGLRTFLNKTDELSGQQIVDNVTDLNSEIERLAAMCVDFDTVTFEKRWKPDENWLLETTTSLIDGHVVSRLCESLVVRGYDHSSDPTLIQLAIQAWEVHCCSRALDAFCLGIAPESDDLLRNVFKEMQRGEPQPVAARWRSLTRSYIKIVQDERGTAYDQALDRLVSYNLEGISIILSYAGCTAPDRPDVETIRSQYGTKVEWIFNQACALAKVAREQIMSADFEVVTRSPGSWFSMDDMEDAAQLRPSAGEEEVEHSEILCTVGFGLTCSTEVKDPEGRVSHTYPRVLMKPRVVLPSMVELMRRDGAASAAGSSRRGRMSIGESLVVLPPYEHMETIEPSPSSPKIPALLGDIPGDSPVDGRGDAGDSVMGAGAGAGDVGLAKAQNGAGDKEEEDPGADGKNDGDDEEGDKTGNKKKKKNRGKNKR